ncbi:anthranilate phosphoribosyltransferase [Vampirovibrio chlorellavorus]|uniref:anthranilate phosphoribosyltransferase n=1 Tax=Vampirovibrio chlorellavorus TaxID=758823 RepID=UPI0026EE4250|nr:anthranilate phosphoribosyltransferase [Vampirovibrio chlorellavorus]
MLSRDQLRQLIHLEYSEAETLDLLGQLTPDHITPALFSDALACLQETALPLAVPSVPVMDCCGTGGSGLPHFNTSTTVAFILAAAGIPVVKFGNRGFSSASGSFDLLAQLGFSERMDLHRIPEVLAQCGLVFLFAPQCYPQLAGFNQLRRTLKTRTLFNFLGPLLNPVKPAYRLLGVSHPGMQQRMADYLISTGTCERGWIVNAESGLDELDIHGNTQVLQLEQNRVSEITLSPSDFSANFSSDALSKNSHHELPPNAHRPTENLKIFMRLLQGDDDQSPYYDMVCLNAGAGLLIAQKTPTLKEGIQEAKQILKSGKALHTLEQCRRVNEQFAC